MMSGGGGGSAGLRYYLHDSAEGHESNPRILRDDFGVSPGGGYEPEDQTEAYMIADTLRDELEMSQQIYDQGERMKHLYEATWMSSHPDDDLTDEEFLDLAEDYLEQMGWEDHRVMVVAHDHTDHADRHLIIDRVDHVNNQALDVDHVMERRIEAERELEVEHGLVEVQPHDRPEIGIGTQKLRPRMENPDRNAEDELESFLSGRAEDGTIESKGDVMEILDEAYLETDDHGNYVTVINPETNGRWRIGEDDIEQIDWQNAEVSTYRESVIEDPVLIEDPAEHLADRIGEKFEKDPSHKMKAQLRDRFESDPEKSVEDLKDDLKVSLDKRDTFEDRIRDRMEEYRSGPEPEAEIEPDQKQDQGPSRGLSL